MRVDVTLKVQGNNTIDCRSWSYSIYTLGLLKLAGEGTLTVIANDASDCGIYGYKNYSSQSNNYGSTGETDVTTLLAASGYSVIRSARTTNADGSYSWTYTVAPVQPD